MIKMSVLLLRCYYSVTTYAIIFGCEIDKKRVLAVRPIFSGKVIFACCITCIATKWPSPARVGNFSVQSTINSIIRPGTVFKDIVFHVCTSGTDGTILFAGCLALKKLYFAPVKYHRRHQLGQHVLLYMYTRSGAANGPLAKTAGRKWRNMDDQAVKNRQSSSMPHKSASMKE